MFRFLHFALSSNDRRASHTSRMSDGVFRLIWGGHCVYLWAVTYSCRCILRSRDRSVEAACCSLRFLAAFCLPGAGGGDRSKGHVGYWDPWIFGLFLIVKRAFYFYHRLVGLVVCTLLLYWASITECLLGLLEAARCTLAASGLTKPLPLPHHIEVPELDIVGDVLIFDYVLGKCKYFLPTVIPVSWNKPCCSHFWTGWLVWKKRWRMWLKVSSVLHIYLLKYKHIVGRSYSSISLLVSPHACPFQPFGLNHVWRNGSM